MPRPCKKRRICEMPACRRFEPQTEKVSDSTDALRTEEVSDSTDIRRTAAAPIVLALDEYECIRLMDREGLTQEQCAAQMHVARTTVQSIYSSARRKLAQCIVDGRSLQIGGGDFELCKKRGCCRKYCLAEPVTRIEKGEGIAMRIGVTYENGQIFQHFGHTEQFKLYDVEDGKVVKTTVVDTNGSGHGALAGFLQENQVDTLICGGIGGGAQNALASAGIRLFGGVSGDADAAVEALLKNELEYSAEATCSRHDHHGHDGDCGSHGCHH